MQTIIWAFSATLILSLFIAFLPIGLTIKGKVFVILSGLILALVGLEAAAFVPSWQAGLILLLLVILAAYLLDSRLAAVIYKAAAIFEEDMKDALPEFIDFGKKETGRSPEIDLSDLAVNETELPSNSQLAESTDGHSLIKQPQMAKEENDLAETLEDDIAFLHKRTDPEIAEASMDSEIEAGYLSDIEDLLQEDRDELEELFFAMDDTAAGNEAPQKEIHFKKTVELQK